MMPQQEIIGSRPDVAAFLPLSFLRQFEPEAGGEWTVTSRSDDSFNIAYVLRGKEPIQFTMHPCFTQDDIEKHCEQFIYEWRGDQSSNSTSPNASQHAITSTPTEKAMVSAFSPAEMAYVSPHEASNPAYVTWNSNLAHHPVQTSFTSSTGTYQARSFDTVPAITHGHQGSNAPDFMNFHMPDQAANNIEWQLANSLPIGASPNFDIVLPPAVMTPSTVGGHWESGPEFEDDLDRPDWELLLHDPPTAS